MPDTDRRATLVRDLRDLADWIAANPDALEYQRRRRRPEPQPLSADERMARETARLADPAFRARFLSRTDRLAPDGCWLWTGCLSAEGYGSVSVVRRSRLAHRIAYRMFNGPISDGLQIDHVCHNRDESCMGGVCIHRRCVNPAHLEAVTNMVNGRRGKTGVVNARRIKAQTHCIRGHEFNEANTYTFQGRRHCRPCRRKGVRDVAA
jgi:hypothetical protein